MNNYLIVLEGVILFLISSCVQQTGEVKKAEDSKDAFTLKKQEVGITLNLPAELLAYEKAEIHAKVDGFVHAVVSDIGDQVKKGQVLARIDAPEVTSQFAQATAKFNESRARFTASKDKYSRIQMAANQQGVISEAEIINTKNQMLADSAALISAQSSARAYGELQDYLTIRAPFDGLITGRFVDIGDFVGNSGKPVLFTLENPRKLRLRVYVPESYTGNIPVNDTLTFTVDAADKIFKAKLARKSGSINRETRTELWEYEYDNKDGHLKPGMYTMTRLQLNRPAGSFVVPFAAVVTSLEKKFVVRIYNGEVKWVDVREGISLEKGKEIFGTLNEGDTLLSRGSDEFKPGSKLTIRVQ